MRLQFSLVIVSFALLVSCQPQRRVDTVAGGDAQTESSGIIGGVVAAENQFPFAVNIWFDSPQDNYVAHLCGASLINKNWVLTAAHCVLEDESESSMRVVKPSKLKMYIASNQHSGDGGKLLKIKSIFVHPEFSWPRFDVALIELTESVTDVLPVALGSEDLGNSSETVTVIGWGLMDSIGKNESSLLRSVSVNLLPRSTCALDAFAVERGIEVGRDMLCIETNNHKTSSCPGDSGGPLLKKTASGYQQIGIVSWGSACGGSRQKLTSSAAGYSDVSAALPWIEKLIFKK
ncbi:S1 family peptidase [Bdellovibrio sp. HCB2-146]|uniref:S1 family peptidase n=1 Tax=Bdellovibrio sp. HCB2-146 TaxID=3394362 RepID=UPI0039BD9268